MECNKDDAIRAMEVAEKKLLSSDFVGAKKMVQTAQRLYPTLENITQLLTVCDIHCSAQNRICGSDNDWYGILQVEQSADETTIKKQYRKFALLLHPDKNKFAGAEAAFKLVGEANRMLSDPAKRRIYDMKYRGTRNIAPPIHQPNGYTTVKPGSGVANGYSSPPYSQFPGRTSYNTQEAFWTICPFCGVKYQYLKCYLSKMLRCQNCGRGFISHDLNNQTVPPTCHQSYVPPVKPPSESGCSKPATKNKHGSGWKSQDRCAGGNQASMKSNTSGNDLSAKAGKKQKARRGNVEDGQGGSVKPRSDAATGMEQGASKGESRKRQRKSATSSANGCEYTQEDGDVLTKAYPGTSRDNCQRRSSRQKKHVSYQKYLSDNDDDIGSPSKKSNSSAQSPDWKEKMKDATGDAAESNVDWPNRKHKYEELKVMRDGTTESDQNSEKSEVEDSDADIDNVTEAQVVVCADPEFSDFDKDKMEHCFDVNQIWAIYDTTDGMPRFYARIKKVFSSAFKLQITWFEPNPDDKDEIDWCDAEMPVACGKYSLGITEETVDLPMFSHLVHGLKRASRSVYFIYPRKGETWALFKNWDIRWRSDPQNVPFNYEFVEILSDYVEDVGILVAYLDKVKGFVCLFQHTKDSELDSLQIPPNQLYRFSHRVPSFRMTGKEREGVPKGSFELDPASLPPNINDPSDFNDVKLETGDLSSGKNDLSRDCEAPNIKMEVIDLERIQVKSNVNSKAPILRRSPRKLNMSKNDIPVDIDLHMPEDNESKDVSHSGLSASKEKIVVHANGGTNTPKKCGKNGIDRETVILRRSPRDVTKMNAG